MRKTVFASFGKKVHYEQFLAKTGKTGFFKKAFLLPFQALTNGKVSGKCIEGIQENVLRTNKRMDEG